MATFLIYILRWAVVLTLLYSLFGLFMKRETMHAVNRMVLLMILVAAMVLPLCQMETQESNVVIEGREILEQQIMAINPTMAVSYIQPDTTAQQPSQHNHLMPALILIYIIGVIMAWTRYLFSLGSLLLLIRQGKQMELNDLPKGVRVLVHPAIKTPCSWMRWVLLSPADAKTISSPRRKTGRHVSGNEAGGEALLQHELAHIHYGHSWDMLLCELTCRMLWCLPFAWMLRQDLRDVHEFQADRRVLRNGIDENEYQLLLIRKATSTGLQPVVNALNQSPIKRRFKMMYRKPSRRWVVLKTAYLVPLSAVTLMAFARPQTMSEIEEKVAATAPSVEKAMKAVASFTGTADFAGEVPLLTGTLTTDDSEFQLENVSYEPVGKSTDTITFSDANLMKADLAGQTEGELRAKGLAAYRSVNDLMDSTMQAVGARKIAEATYVGHFQPNLNSDTLRIRHVKVLDRHSQVAMASGISTVSADDPYAYDLTLQLETRKDRKGYYIRFLQPANSTTRHYDHKQVDPKLLSTDSVLTKRSSSHLLTMKPVAIERSKKETRLFTYTGFRSDSNVEEMQKRNYNIYHDYAIVDEQTGDKYVYRFTDYTYFKYVKDEYIGKDTIKVYQTCLVFPPIDKRVNAVHFGSKEDNDRFSDTFSLSDIPRKGRVITN